MCEPTEENVAKLCHLYRGVFHGVDRHGVGDVEFLDLATAVAFVDIIGAKETATIRDEIWPPQPFNSRVVIQIRVTT